MQVSMRPRREGEGLVAVWGVAWGRGVKVDTLIKHSFSSLYGHQLINSDKRIALLDKGRCLTMLYVMQYIAWYCTVSESGSGYWGRCRVYGVRVGCTWGVGGCAKSRVCVGSCLVCGE